MSTAKQSELSPRTTPCDLCAADEFELISEFDRRGQPLRTVVCRRCGLVSHEHIPSDDDLAEYYAREYRQSYHGEYTPSPHRVLRSWGGGQWLLKLLRPHLRSGARVFEVGAGIGCTVKSFEKAGFDASGIEPGEGFYDFARAQLQARVERRSLEDVPPAPTYDLVMLVHVIEHFNSPRRALERIARILKPGGALYIECPNVAAPHAAPGRLFHFAHIYNFTPETLLALARSCGFQVQRRLSGPHDPSLRFLLRRDESFSRAAIDQGSQPTLRALRKYNSLTYRLRPSYLWSRVQRDVRFLSHHIAPRWRLRRLVARCQVGEQ